DPNLYTDFTFLAGYPVEFNCPLHVGFDNFSEDEHFPYVHKVVGWNEENSKDMEYEFLETETTTNVYYRGKQRKLLGMGLYFMKEGDPVHNNGETRFDPVRTEYVLWNTNKKGEKSTGYSRSCIFFVPNGQKKMTLVVFSFVKPPSPKFNWMLKVFRKPMVE